jgi:hypothetical protein
MYLLEHAQTLLGVLTTLIVLCLFNNQSNFLRVLFQNIVEDVKEQVRLYNNNISESESAANQADSNQFVAPRFKNAKFLSKAGKVLKELDSKFDRFDTGKELEMIELHLLLLSVVVILCDVFIKLTPELEFFFVMMTVMSFMHTSSMWYRVYCMGEFTAQQSSISDLGKDRHLTRLVSVAFVYVMMGILSLGVFFIPANPYSILAVQVCVILLLFTFHGKRKWRQMAKMKYSYRFAVKHAMIIIAYPVIPALCMCLMLRCGWLYDWAASHQVNWIVNGCDTWCENINAVYRHTAVGNIFTIYVAVYSVLIPIVLGYYITRKHAKDSLKEIDRLIEQDAKEAEPNGDLPDAE